MYVLPFYFICNNEIVEAALNKIYFAVKLVNFFRKKVAKMRFDEEKLFKNGFFSLSCPISNLMGFL